MPLLVDQAIGFTGNDADHQFPIRSSIDLPHDVTLNAELHQLGSLPQPALPSYVELNAQIGWRMTNDVQVSLTASNLPPNHHVEFTDSATTVE